MKSNIFQRIGIFLFLCFLFSSVGLTAEVVKVELSHKKWLLERMNEASSIKSGMTNHDLAKYFRQDGGISSIKVSRFTMIACPLIKVDVEFEDVKKDINHPENLKTIKTISKPYLEEPYFD